MVQEVKRMDQLLIEIGDRIRRRRKQLGLTQEDLSNRTDVTTQTISNAELGLKGMRPDTIIRICRALEISTDYLLLGEIGDSDKSLFSERLATLTPNQMKHLIDIVDITSLMMALACCMLSFTPLKTMYSKLRRR